MAFQGNVANVTELMLMAPVALAASLLVPVLAPALLTELARHAREPPTVMQLVRMATVTMPRAMRGVGHAPVFLDVGRQQ